MTVVMLGINCDGGTVRDDGGDDDYSRGGHMIVVV